MCNSAGCKCVGKCPVCKCEQKQVHSMCRQGISWKQARELLKLGNPAEYYRSFSTKERRLMHGKKPDSFVKVEIFSPKKDSPIVLFGGATIEFGDDNCAYFCGFLS